MANHDELDAAIERYYAAAFALVNGNPERRKRLLPQ
jgi:hypothetical protein